MHKVIIKIWTLVFLLCLFVRCNKPPTTFERDNEKDPLSKNFTVTGDDEIEFTLLKEKLKIEWDDFSEIEAGYIIEKAVNDTTDLTEYEILKENAVSFTDNNIQHFHLTYKISPFIKTQGGIQKLAFKKATINLSEPTKVNLQLDNEKEARVNVLYDKPTDFIEGFEIYRAIFNSFQTDIVEYHLISKVFPKNKENFTFTDTTLLKARKIYQYKVRAFNTTGKSFYKSSDRKRFVIQAPLLQGIESIEQTSLKLKWSYYQGYSNNYKPWNQIVIERSKNTPNNFKKVQTLSASKTSSTIRNLDQNSTHYFRIRSLASGYSDTLKVAYDLGITKLKEFDGRPKALNIIFHPNKNNFVTLNEKSDYSGNRGFDLWDTSNFDSYYSYYPSSTVTSIDFNDKGNFLIFGNEDGLVQSYAIDNSQGNKNISYNTKTGSKVLDLVVRPKNLSAAITYNNENDDPEIAIVEYNSESFLNGTLAQKILTESLITDIKYNSDGSLLLASGKDGAIRVYDTNNNYTKLRTLIDASGTSDKIGNFIVNDDKTIYAATQNGSVKFWTINDSKVQNTISFEKFNKDHYPSSLVLSKNEELLIIGSNEGYLLTWNLEKNKLIQSFYLPKNFYDHKPNILGLDINKEGSKLVSISRAPLSSGPPILWDLSKKWVQYSSLN